MSGGDPLEDEDLVKQLNVLTGDLLPVRITTVVDVGGRKKILKGRYFMEEEDLPGNLKELLHGRAYVVDKDLITEVSSAAPKTYYISADKAKGIIIPGRSMCISADGDLTYVSGDAHYRWTDDGERWTEWISLPVGRVYSYLQAEKTRFAEVEAYTDAGGIKISLIVTR